MLSSFNIGIIIICIKTLIMVFIIDNILKYIIRRDARYFLLHLIFNMWITFIVWNDAIHAIFFPFEMFKENYVYSTILSTSGIASFHIYHIIAYSDLTIEDWIHHLISSIVVAGIGIYLPLGKCPSLANLAMCGLPGGIDYLLLVLVKLDIIDKIREKAINRYLNLIIRWPIMFLTSYLVTLNTYHGNVDTTYLPIMVIGSLLHCYNAIYYCDKVIGNYYIKRMLKNNKNK